MKSIRRRDRRGRAFRLPAGALLVFLVACAGAPTSPTAESETAGLASEPVPVPYFTPPQQEGPYYPEDKPAERDNDLVAVAGAAGTPRGQVLELGGTVYDRQGRPLPGVTVEIWQTDAGGVYDHPGDPGTAGRDPNFQFYGEAVSDADGRYQFRTILPGRYEPRPRHIHAKLRYDGRELLTTQFYFADDVQGDGAQGLLIIDPRRETAKDGQELLVGERDVYLDVLLDDG